VNEILITFHFLVIIMRRVVVFSLALLFVSGTVLARESNDRPSEFIEYPVFQKKSGRVEAVTDKGLIQEFIIRCPDVAGIITFSKVDGAYCTPEHRCSASLSSAIKRLC